MEAPAPRCLSCAYTLSGLHSPGACPECGQRFDLADCTTYALRPPFLRWNFWFPGLCLSVLGGTAVVAILAFALGNWGASLWLGVPFSVGCILGYRLRVRWYLLPLFCLVGILGLILGLVSLSLAGVYCGLVLGAIFLVPIFVGAVLGVVLRHHLKARGFSQASYLPILFFWLIPLAGGVIEGRPCGAHPESVSTEIVIPAPVARCWDAIMFYEEVTHEPPLILRIGLAHPLYTIGASCRPGDVKTCIYNKGRITKRITAVAERSVLEFEVIEQHIGYERDVRLIGGSFHFEPLGPASTRVTLTTTYEPYLSPRFCWRPGERLAIHLLHRHVLEGMRLKSVAVGLAATGGPP
jgi:hypothetical protein